MRVGALSGIVQNRSYRPTEEELDEFTELVNMNINKILKLKEDTMRFFLDETRWYFKRRKARLLRKLYKKIVHKLIVKYLISCWGAFHHGKYGENGIYVVMMSDEMYHEFQKIK